MADLSADDAPLSFRTHGSGPRKVLLVHGWMVSGHVYDAFIEALDATGLTLIVPDLRGSGASPRPSSGHTLERHTRDVLAAADAAGAKSFVVVGHSMGGQIAQAIAAEAPSRVEGLALLCPVPASGLGIPPEARALFRTSAGKRDAQKTILGLACKMLSDDARERLLDDAGKVSAAAVEEGVDAFTAGFSKKLGPIDAPALVLATDDPFLPPALLRETVVAPIRRARLAYLPGPGHYPQAERPAETAAVVSGFLAGLG